GEVRRWRRDARVSGTRWSPCGALGAGVDPERPRRRELAELVPDHRLGDVHGHVLAAVVDRDRVSHHVRSDGLTTRPRLDDPPGLADLDEPGLDVADLADGGAAVDRHPAHLGRREPQRGEIAFLGHELHGGAGAAGELAARTRLELDVVHGRADRDVAQRQGVARARLRALAAARQVTDDDTGRGEDVALLAVEVVQQRDAG